jgi:hypothetical protein
MNLSMMVRAKNNQIPAMVLMKVINIPRAIRELLTAHVMDLQIARRMTYRALANIDALIICALLRRDNLVRAFNQLLPHFRRNPQKLVILHNVFRHFEPIQLPPDALIYLSPEQYFPVLDLEVNIEMAQPPRVHALLYYINLV